MTHINAWMLSYAKSKNCQGIINLLAEWRSVARVDSILGLPVFWTSWVTPKFVIYTPKQEAKFARPFSCRSSQPLTRVLDLINLMKP